MAIGFRSPFFKWVGGLSTAGTVPPAVLCPCPTYGHDETLTSQFFVEQSLSNQFIVEKTLLDTFQNEPTLSKNFTNEQTLGKTWKRGQCNG